MKRTQRLAIVAAMLIVLPIHLWAQEENQEGDEERFFKLGVGVSLGVNSFEDPDTGDVDTYQLLALRPDFAFGKFGIGLDLPINYRFTGGNGDDFEVREEDWEPSGDRSFLDVYLPKFRYVRYGVSGDPVYALFGGFSRATLGSGFIMNSYSNELFIPDRRLFGGIVEVDGEAVGFPYAGFETIAGNVAAMDVVGGRFYVRPIVGTGIPVISSLQLGSTFVIDRDPFYHLKLDPLSPYSDDFDDPDIPQIDPPSEDVVVWGVDAQQPILDTDVISLVLLGDIAFQEDRRGGMGGFSGRLFRVFLYGGQLRVTDDNFVPQYFDYSYDVRRAEKYAIYNEDIDVPGGVGWLGRLGVAFFQDALVFDTNVSGSFNPEPGSYPELRSTLTLTEGLIPGFSGFSFQGSYTKFDLRRWDDLTDAENALIGARFNVRSGPVTISLTYDLTYDPYNPGDPWIVRSGLESTLSF